MRFVVTGEWNRNRLLQTIVVLYSLYVGGLWVTNALLYFAKMGLTPASVVSYYRGNEEQFLSPRSYQGMLEVAHFHLFAMGWTRSVESAVYRPASHACPNGPRDGR